MLRNSAISLVTRLLMAVSRTVVVLAVVVWLGPVEQGMLSVSVAVSVIASMLIGAGIEVANGYLSANRPADLSAIVWNSLGVSVVGGGTLGVILWLAFPVLPFFESVALDYQLPLALSVAPASAFVLVSGVAVGLNRYGLLLASNAILYVTYLVIGVGAAALGASASVILIAWAVGNTLGVLWLLAALPISRAPTLRLELLRRQVAFGSRAYWTNLLNWLNFRVDLLIVISLIGPAAAGFYAVATTLAESLLYLGKAAAQPLMTHALRGGREWSPPVEHAYRAVLAATLLLATAVIVLSPIVSRAVVGPELDPALLPLAVLALAQVPMAMAMMASAHLFGLGVPGRTIPGGVLAFVVTITLDFIAIPALSITGAAVVALVSYSVGAVMQLHQVMHTVRSGARWRSLVPRPRDAVALWTVGIGLLRRQSPS